MRNYSVFMVEGPSDIRVATGEAIRTVFARQEVVGLVRETLLTEGRASVEGLWGSSAPALAATGVPEGGRRRVPREALRGSGHEPSRRGGMAWVWKEAVRHAT